ncbi:MAG: hypothetical protein MJ108_06280 [Saccharofermentans sp.]|nr:hypothetical protein [Saccharofermentans sp.]
MFIKLLGIPTIILLVLTITLVVLMFYSKTRKKTIIFGIGSWVGILASAFVFEEHLSVLEYPELRRAHELAGYMASTTVAVFIAVAIIGLLIRKRKPKAIVVTMLTGFFAAMAVGLLFVNFGTYIEISRFMASDKDMPVVIAKDVTIQNGTTYQITDLLDISNSQGATFSTIEWSHSHENTDGIVVNEDRTAFCVEEGQGQLTVYVRTTHAVTTAQEFAEYNFIVEGNVND